MITLNEVLFDCLPCEERHDLSRASVLRTYQRGTTLFHEEDPAEQLFVLVEGRVRVWLSSPLGASMTVHLAGPGDAPGLVSVIRATPFPATATVLETAVASTWPAERIRALAAEHPRFMSVVLDVMAARAHDMLQRLHEVSTLAVPQRVSRALMRMTDPRACDAGPCRVAATRQELAELSATTLHTVSRLVSRWDRDGIVSAGRKCVTILDPLALSAIAGMET